MKMKEYFDRNKLNIIL